MFYIYVIMQSDDGSFDIINKGFNGIDEDECGFVTWKEVSHFGVRKTRTSYG